MKTIRLLLMTFVIALSGSSLLSQDLIDLTLVLPNEYEGISADQTTRLNNRVKQVVTRNGVSSDFFGGSFIISPSFQVLDRVVAEGGMKPVIKTNTELTLEVYEKGSKTVFASVTKSISGAGYSDLESLNNAITSISSTDPAFKKFFTSVKEKISNYYAENCEKFIKKAQYCIDTKDYETALIVIHSIPDGISCSDRAKKMGVLISEIKEEAKLKPEVAVETEQISTEMPVSVSEPVVNKEVPKSYKEINLSNTLTLRYVDCENYGNTMTLNFTLINSGEEEVTPKFNSVYLYDEVGAKFYPSEAFAGNQRYSGLDWGLMSMTVNAVAGVSTKIKFVFDKKVADIKLFELTCNDVKYKIRDLLK